MRFGPSRINVGETCVAISRINVAQNRIAISRILRYNNFFCHHAAEYGIILQTHFPLAIKSVHSLFG